MQPKGKYYRNFVKTKALIFLAKVREFHEPTDQLKMGVSSGQIARCTHSSYDALRTLLRRWSQHPFLYNNHKLGKQQTKNGYRYCHETVAREYGGSYKYGYKITAKGLNYLAKQEIEYPYFQMAVDEVIRYTSKKIRWKDPVLNLYVFIRPPFAVNEDCYTAKVPDPKENAVTEILPAYNFEDAFYRASKLNPPPSQKFRAWAFTGINQMRLKVSPNAPPPTADRMPTPQSPNHQQPPSPAIRKLVPLRINPAGAQRLNEYFNQRALDTSGDNGSGW